MQLQCWEDSYSDLQKSGKDIAGALIEESLVKEKVIVYIMSLRNLNTILCLVQISTSRNACLYKVLARIPSAIADRRVAREMGGCECKMGGSYEDTYSTQALPSMDA